MNIPRDYKRMTEKYGGENKGICGQSCLAVITNDTIYHVLRDWKAMGLEWKGYSGWNQLKSFLKKRGFEIKQVNGEPDYSMADFHIARIQWIGDGENKEKPFYGWGHWSEASANTHFIVMDKESFFCNEYGYFKLHELGQWLDNYGACITSHLAVWVKHSQSNDKVKEDA